jgi:small-conductance mechanosensitive channel
MSDATRNLLADLFSDLEQSALLWQVAVLAGCLLLAWAIKRVLLGYLPKTGELARIGLEAVAQMGFPLAALLLVLVGKSVLQHWFPVNLLNIAVPLLLALLLIRLVVYTLRHVFPQSPWLRGSERFIAIAVWLVFALHLSGFLPAILEALDSLGFNVGKHRISLLIILSGVLSVMITMLIAMWLGRTLESKVMVAENIDISLRVVLAKLIRAVLVVIGIVIALPLAGIDITMLSVFGGALGVGIGFGLQKIAGNYVSGFIILLDRSIRPGDVLTVDGRTGTVTQLTTRYLVLKGGDGNEALIPNELLISSIILNHSYTDRTMRMIITLQISYQSDLQRAMAIMEQAAHAQPRVMADPPAQVFLKSFGDNGIDLELGFWINDPEEGQLNLSSAINIDIWRKFQEAGIVIPSPQRDIHLIRERPASA